MDAEKTMSKATEITYFWGTRLDAAIDVLTREKEKGNNVFIDFNGKKLYSLFDDENSCYLKVVGKSKREREEEMRRYFVEDDRLAWESIKTDIIKYIYPQRKKLLDDTINAGINGFISLDAINLAISIIRELDKGKIIGEIYETLKKTGRDPQEELSDVTLNIVARFSKRGPEFYKATKGKLSITDQGKMMQIEKENVQFAEELATQRKE